MHGSPGELRPRRQRQGSRVQSALLWRVVHGVAQRGEVALQTADCIREERS